MTFVGDARLDMNVVDLKTRPVVINQQTVSMLTEWLALAQRGEIIGVAAVGFEPGGSIISGATDGDSFPSLLGGIEVLKFRLMQQHCVS